MSKHFCFTIWGGNPPKWKPEEFAYLTYQREEGEKRGRGHWQGFVSFHSPHTRDSAHALFDQNGLGYFEYARDLQSAIRYAQKGRTRIAPFVEMGQRTC